LAANRFLDVYLILACPSDRHFGKDGGIVDLSIFRVLDDKFFHVIVIELLEFNVDSMEVHAAVVRIALALLIDGLELLLKSALGSFLDKGRNFAFGLVGLVLRLVISSLVLALALGFASVSTRVALSFLAWALSVSHSSVVRVLLLP